MKIESLRESEDTLCCFRNINVKGCRLLWEITSRCNLKCLHCFVKSNKKELSTKEALKIIEQLPVINVKKVLFSGGEPLIRNDIFELIKNCIDKGIHVDLNTNATLINFNVAKKLQKVELREITTSIDGADAKTHEKIRRVIGSFKKTIESIKILKEIGFKVDVVCVANKINKGGIESVIDLAYLLGIDSITLSNLILRGKALENIKKLKLTLIDLQEIKKTINKKRGELPSFSIRTLGMPWGSLEECNAGKGILYLDSQGIIHPCSLFTSISSQSVKMKEIKEILKSPDFKNFKKIGERTCPLLIKK